MDKDELLKKFCNNEPVHFGSDDNGIEIIATVFDSESDFLSEYKKRYCDYAEDDDFDVHALEVHFSKSIISEECEGFFARKEAFEMPSEAIYIGRFYGIEY